MRKADGKYSQYLPNLNIGINQIQPVQPGGSFTYLGKIFEFDMNNSAIKSEMAKHLSTLLKTTSELDIKPQSKLKILQYFIPSKFTFDLRIYDISYTWIEQFLDAQRYNAIKDWMSYPISTCVNEMLELSKDQGGFGIPSFKSTAEKLRQSMRWQLKTNANADIRNLWKATSNKNIKLDANLIQHPTKKDAIKALSNDQCANNLHHLQSLNLQYKLLQSVAEHFSKSEINRWATTIDKLPTHLFTFVKKALQQQLPTAVNLKRWGKTADDHCPLCQHAQMNKHVLANCGSVVALKRYKSRHDAVLTIVAEWLKSTLGNCALHADILNSDFNPLSDLFLSQRPDIAILSSDQIICLELTVCHETNVINSRSFKQSKYMTLQDNLCREHSNKNLVKHTVEVTNLGLISNISDFAKSVIVKSLDENIKRCITNTVIAKSFDIYCSRNDAN